MIYRYHYQHNASHFSCLETRKLPLPAGVRGYLSNLEYENIFEAQTINSDPYWVEYKAPKLAKWMIPSEYVYRLNKGKLNDILWGTGFHLMSQRACAVLEELDPSLHQYIPVFVSDNKGQMFNDTQYYTVNIRRHIEICPTKVSRSVKSIPTRYFPKDIEALALPTIVDNLDLLNKLSSFPIWQFKGDRHQFYMSEKMLEAMRDAGLTGINNFTWKNGKSGESVCSLWETTA